MNIEIITDTEYKIDIDIDKIVNNVVRTALVEYYGGDGVELSVTLTDNEGIHKLNKEFRDIDSPTDVLSFPLLEFETPGDFESIASDSDIVDPDTDEIMLGDIVISLEKVVSQAEEYGHSKDRELAFLVAHSMLHLMGYDHIDDEERKDMESRQEDILSKAGYIRE